MKDVGRMIFSLGIGSIPVISGKKLIGIVTQQDILSHLFPSLKEVVEDYVHARNFEEMEKNFPEILSTPVSLIMNKNVTSISPDMSIMEAQSVMLLGKFSHLPVVDKKGDIVGMVSQGDIFRSLIKDEMPQLEKEEYAIFVARYYDLMVNWEKRFEYEFPSLIRLFARHKVKSILDLGVWTGKYTIGLAEEGGYKILGLDHNGIMIKMSEEKREKLPEWVKNNVHFLLTSFKDFSRKIDEKLDAAICMGGSLPYFPVSFDVLFSEVAKTLRKDNPLIVLQILNFDKVLKQGGLLSFKIQKSRNELGREHLFLELLEKKSEDSLLHRVIIFDSDGKNWIFKGITTIDIAYMNKEIVEKELRKIGFKNISFSGNIGEYQGEYGRLSFIKPFDKGESDWLNVVATK